ncbi:unnamed protein product [Pseudo-nitzschia multistriata]|uniref:TAFII55 protein conserved region domain-containing protein n=1 Tax=Pseudo-nitzschia multistriata TaxID=183589 RepID=A0A448ZRS1_9STRA|nr:unnamed protein product [Pseudo-nitzschia multistriata]
MKEVEEAADTDPDTKSATERSNTGRTSSSSGNHNKEILLDLDGVACEPTKDSSTLWNFHCDGATYPARLVNLPCPVELHKTHDHAMYYKCCDIAQMLIVYEDSMALDDADAYPKKTGYPSYYHSGITLPMKQVVERRFGQRDHQPGIKFPRNEVSDVERELHELMCKISKEGGKGRKLKIPSLANQNKVLQEVEEEVVIDYEPWMEDGIEFEATDQIASLHPEIWLSPEKIKEIKQKEEEKEEEERKKRQKEREKKEKKKKKKEQKVAAKKAAAEVAAAAPLKRKGIPSKKYIKEDKKEDDFIEQSAKLALKGDDFSNEDFLGDGLDDLGFNFDDADLI